MVIKRIRITKIFNAKNICIEIKLILLNKLS